MTDYLAFPEEGLSAGRPVSYFDQENFASGEDGYFEDGMPGGEFFDEGLVTDGDAYFDGALVTDGDVSDEGVPAPELIGELPGEAEGAATPAEEAP